MAHIYFYTVFLTKLQTTSIMLFLVVFVTFILQLLCHYKIYFVAWVCESQPKALVA